MSFDKNVKRSETKYSETYQIFFYLIFLTDGFLKKYLETNKSNKRFPSRTLVLFLINQSLT